MSLRTALAAVRNRIGSAIAGKALIEGTARPGPWSLPVTGATWSVGAPSYGGWINNWQLGGEPWQGSQSGIIEGCLALYAGVMATLPVAHFIRLDDGSKERIDSSDAARIFVGGPNSYQSWADFVGEATRCLFLEGNFYALGQKNSDGESDELHPMDPLLSRPTVVIATIDGIEERGLGYTLGGNAFVDPDLDPAGGGFNGYGRPYWPARHVLHFKLPSYNNRKPSFLIGESPLVSLFDSQKLIQRLTAMLDRQGPRAVASIDHVASREQITELRDRLKEGLNGGVPILSAGSKLEPWSGQALTPRDIQFLEVNVFAREEVCTAFRVPGALLGLDKATSGTTKDLILQWRQMGLGATVEIFEQALTRFFGLRGYPFEWIEFDLDALSRGDERERIENLVRATQGGLYSIDEARAREDLGRVPGGWGAMPRVQAQNVPLDAAAAIEPSAPSSPAPSALIGARVAEANSRPRVRQIARLTVQEETHELERLMRKDSRHGCD
jgi:HK97 family phage portal protein